MSRRWPEESPELARAEAIVKNMPNAPAIKTGARACYMPPTDTVTMPKRKAFKVPAEYYSTLFHELTHSTRHDSRLDRREEGEDPNTCRPFGSTDYSKEELVAEMGASFLCGIAGVENLTIDNSAAYIKSWLRKLKDDPKFVVIAAAQAQKAADYIINRKFETDVENEEGLTPGGPT